MQLVRHLSTFNLLCLGHIISANPSLLAISRISYPLACHLLAFSLTRPLPRQSSLNPSRARTNAKRSASASLNASRRIAKLQLYGFWRSYIFVFTREVICQARLPRTAMLMYVAAKSWIRQ
ncbi:hypothetical protein GGI42DRAFT_304743 [Trichoderma sp. SZMC 28013]